MAVENVQCKMKGMQGGTDLRNKAMSGKEEQQNTVNSIKFGGSGDARGMLGL